MTDLVTLVIQGAALRRLETECGPIDREVAQLIADIEHLSVEECRRGDFLERFMELLRRRGEIAREALSGKQNSQRQQSAAAEPEGRLALVLDGSPRRATADRRNLEWLTHMLRALTGGNKMDEPDALRSQADQLLALVRQLRDTDSPYTEKLIATQ